MITHSLDPARSILHLQPRAPLAKADFEQLAREVDPFLAEHGRLAGMLVEARTFPGWDSLGALASHLRFVRDHHRLIRRIALVTDSPLGGVAEHLASHFVAAEIRHFPHRELEAAREWLTSAS